MTVAVIDPTQKEFSSEDSDFRIEWFSGTGAGGQNRNKCMNSCRLIHIESGVIVTSQTRSRISSLALAKKEMTSRLKATFDNAASKVSAEVRKNQVGSGMRGDKIRTYRFQDDTVKDHMTNKSSSVKKIMAGNFNLLW